MSRVCRVLLAVLAVAYAAALALLTIGSFGLFGQERDPLAGVYLVILGLPWNRMLQPFPDASLPWLTAASPAINIGIVWLICRLVARSKRA